MQRGIFSFFSQNLSKKTSSKEVAGKVTNEISQGQIIVPIDLETYTIPPSNYTSAIGTIILPSNGTWLIITNIYGTSGNSFQINSTPIFLNNGSALITSVHKKVVGNSFEYSYTLGIIIYSIDAIKLRNE